jgi:hypothetical protein
MKWTHGDKELDEFVEHANSIHPSIKFTHEVSKTKMSFLLFPYFYACGNSVIMGNVRVKGSYIHGNKRGIFWNGSRGSQARPFLSAA